MYSSLINFIKRHKIIFSLLLLFILASPFILPMPMRCVVAQAEERPRRGGWDGGSFEGTGNIGRQYYLDCYSMRYPGFWSKEGMLRYHWAFFPSFDYRFHSSGLIEGDIYSYSPVTFHI